MIRPWLTGLALLILASGAAARMDSRNSPTAAKPDAKPNAIIVAYRSGASTTARVEVRQGAQATRWRRLSRTLPHLERLQLPPGASVAATVKKLQQNPDVRYAEPDYPITAEANSNDPYYTSGSMWGMYGDTTSPANAFGSQAGEAWAAGYTGDRGVVVGVIDEGVDISHPDLAANIWTNPFEVAGNGLDDDGNGYIDDVHGWDFYHGDASVFDGAALDTHGTHVAGTIGGVGGNGIGVAGVNWQVTLIPMKFMHAGSGLTSDAVIALDYLTDLKTRHGIAVVATSNSWGSSGESQALDEAINRAGDAGILFVTSAGNDGVNTDTTPHFPSSSTCTTRTRGEECLISVAALAASGARAGFSNFGPKTVDIGAPGMDINSTQPANSYLSFDGTSMATPHVAGAIALCKAINPSLGMSDLRALLMRTAAATPSLAGVTVTGSRLDVGALATACAAAPTAVNGAPSGLASGETTRSTIALSWSDNATNESTFELQRSNVGCASFITVDSITADATTYTATGLEASTTYCFRLRGVNPSGTPSGWSNTLVATTADPPSGYQCAATTHEWLSAAGGSNFVMPDDSQVSIALPFNVDFYGTTVSTLTVSSNGFVRMGSGSATSWINATLPSAGEPNGLVAVYWDDLNPGSGGSVMSRTLGTAPTRRYVVSWNGIPHFDAPGNPVSVQLVIEEATGDLVMNYLDTDHGDVGLNNGASATIGVEDAGGEFGALVSFNQAMAPSGSSIRCTAAPPPVRPANFAGAATSSSTVSLTWTDGTGELGYVLERSTGTDAFATVATTAANTAAYVDAGLSPATTYRYRVKARNDAGDSAYAPEISVTTLPTLPATPAGPTVTIVGRTVTLRWADNSNNETRFEQGRSTYNTSTAQWSAPVMIATSPANSTRRTISNEVRGSHRYYIRARNAAGTSVWRGPSRLIIVR